MTTPGLNAPLTVAKSLTGLRLDPYMSFNFLVEFGSLVVGGFSDVSGLQIETEVTEYREGGLNQYMHQLAGPTKYPSKIVLKHGLTDVESMWQWHQGVVEGQIKRRNGTIYLLSPQRIPVIWWDIKEAFPVKWSGPEFAASSTEVAVETLELVHRGISRPGTSSAAAVGHLAATLGQQL